MVIDQTSEFLQALDSFAEGLLVAALTVDGETVYGTDAAAELVIALADDPRISRFCVNQNDGPMKYKTVS